VDGTGSRLCLKVDFGFIIVGSLVSVDRKLLSE
jgi:hypothetical protein